MLDKIEQMLTDRQMGFDRIEVDIIASGFSTTLEDGSVLGFPLYIQDFTDPYGDKFIRLNIVPLIDPQKDGYSADVILTAMNLNHDMPIIKIAMDSEGKIELILDFSVKDFSMDSLTSALQLLTDYSSACAPLLSQINMTDSNPETP